MVMRRGDRKGNDPEMHAGAGGCCQPDRGKGDLCGLDAPLFRIETGPGFRTKKPMDGGDYVCYELAREEKS